MTNLPHPNPIHGVRTMKRYVIERDLPGVGGLNRQQLKEAATKSNGALEIPTSTRLRKDLRQSGRHFLLFRSVQNPSLRR